jgi:hypothetical protein
LTYADGLAAVVELGLASLPSSGLPANVGCDMQLVETCFSPGKRRAKARAGELREMESSRVFERARDLCTLCTVWVGEDGW